MDKFKFKKENHEGLGDVYRSIACDILNGIEDIFIGKGIEIFPNGADYDHNQELYDEVMSNSAWYPCEDEIVAILENAIEKVEE